MVDDVFVPFRPRGAEYAWMVLPGYGHEYAENRQDLLIMPLMDLAVRAPLPQRRGCDQRLHQTAHHQSCHRLGGR